MREIKFRVWDIFYKKFYYKIYNLDEALKNENYVIQQFTGLKDKNGREIYEGDILREIRVLMGLVTYGRRFAVEYKINSFYDGAVIGFNIDNYEIFEIVGNIFENPELCENEK